MTDPDAASARELIDRSRYMTIATADAEGRPWASPVWFAHEDHTDFFWVSRPDAQHSLNIKARGAVALVVFDSTVAPSAAQAVYVEAVAEEVDDDTLEHAIGVFAEKSLRTGLSDWSPADVTGEAHHRLYRAHATASFALASTDRRVRVALRDHR